jgi:hypothetical protein
MELTDGQRGCALNLVSIEQWPCRLRPASRFENMSLGLFFWRRPGMLGRFASGFTRHKYWQWRLHDYKEKQVALRKSPHGTARACCLSEVSSSITKNDKRLFRKRSFLWSDLKKIVSNLNGRCKLVKLYDVNKRHMMWKKLKPWKTLYPWSLIDISLAMYKSESFLEAWMGRASLKTPMMLLLSRLATSVRFLTIAPQIWTLIVTCLLATGLAWNGKLTEYLQMHFS